MSAIAHVVITVSEPDEFTRTSRTHRFEGEGEFLSRGKHEV
jgi:hypothetical protein